jgi:hypothetical protein
VPVPKWSYETVETVVTTIEKYLAPELIGLDPFDIHALHRANEPSHRTLLLHWATHLQSRP